METRIKIKDIRVGRFFVFRIGSIQSERLISKERKAFQNEIRMGGRNAPFVYFCTIKQTRNKLDAVK